jgi:hypothetical protein
MNTTAKGTSSGLTIGSRHIKAYDGTSATEFERKISEVIDAALTRGIPSTTWTLPSMYTLPIKGDHKNAFPSPEPIAVTATMAEIEKYHAEVKRYTESEHRRLALESSYRSNLKAWEDHQKVRTEAIGYLRAIFHNGKLAAAMRGRDDPHIALNAMRQLLGISDPD